MKLFVDAAIIGKFRDLAGTGPFQGGIATPSLPPAGVAAE